MTIGLAWAAPKVWNAVNTPAKAFHGEPGRFGHANQL
jgi:hypothetical protein